MAPISPNADVSTIVYLAPMKFDEFKPGLIPSQFIIEPVKDPMKDFSLFHVARARFPVYLDEDRPALIVPAPSDTVAESLCRDYKVSIACYEPGVSEPGLFWLRGYLNKDDILTNYGKELERARTLQVEWFKRLVGQADDDWAKYRMRKMISSIQKAACTVLKLEREWNVDKEVAENLGLRPCKFCRELLDPLAIVCKSCQGIVDPEKYKREFVKAAAPA